MEKMASDYEIVFVDDGSGDASFNVLKKIASGDGKVKILSFSRNFGQHPAVIAGFEAASGEMILTLDADLQNPPEEIPRLIEAMRGGHDMVSGIRSARQDTAFRRSGSFFTVMFLNILSGSNVRDYGTMLRAFRKDFAKTLAERYRKERLYIPVLVNKLTKNILEVEAGHETRFSGSSKYGMLKLIKTFISIFIRWHHKLSLFLQSVHMMKKDGILYEIEEKINL